MADGAKISSNLGWDEDPARRKRLIVRRALSAGVAVIALAAFGSILVYAYNEGREQSAGTAPVLLKPASGPYKVRPETPGGMVVPDRDKEVYESISAKPAVKKVERMMPLPEQPVRPPRVEQAALKTAKPAPAKRKSIDLAMAVPRSKTGRLAAPAKKPVMTPKPAQASEPSETHKARLPPKNDKANSSHPAFRVQIASLRSKAAVDKAWKTLLRQHQDLLSSLNLSVQKADLGPPKGVYFRMHAGPFDDRASARKFCSKLTSRKVGCFVVGR